MPDRTFAGGHFALDIMGSNAGFVKRFEGLNMDADIVTDDLGPANGQKKKHVASVKWTPAKATIGIGMSKALYSILQQALAARQKPFDGRLDAADFNFRTKSSFAFDGAIMTAVTFPTMDGSSKEPAYFDLEWEAETVRWQKGDDSDIRGTIVSKPKAWMSSNFRFEMGGLPCDRVATIDSFTWRCIPEPGGRRAAKVTVPDVKISVSMADYEEWAEAATKWFVDGHHSETDEMSGAIVFLGPDMKTELGRVSLRNCGFAKFTHGPFEADGDAIARFTVEFYVEQMELSIKSLDA